MHEPTILGRLILVAQHLLMLLLVRRRLVKQLLLVGKVDFVLGLLSPGRSLASSVLGARRREQGLLICELPTGGQLISCVLIDQTDVEAGVGRLFC